MRRKLADREWDLVPLDELFLSVLRRLRFSGEAEEEFWSSRWDIELFGEALIDIMSVSMSVLRRSVWDWRTCFLLRRLEV